VCRDQFDGELQYFFSSPVNFLGAGNPFPAAAFSAKAEKPKLVAAKTAPFKMKIGILILVHRLKREIILRFF